jgi:lysophospholipase L1-like esterase
VNYLRWVPLVLLVLLPVGCGEEPETKEPAIEEPAVEESTTATTAANGSLGYVALGDSLATGDGATNGYVYRYADLLEVDTETTVNVYNLGVSGLTSERLRAEIEHNQSARDAIGQAEVITINIGANDLLWARGSYRTGGCGGADNQDCLRQAVEDFQTNWDAILAEVTGLRSPDVAIVRTIDFYNPSVNVDRATGSRPDAGANDFEVFKRYLEQVNSHIAKSSDAYGIPYARVYEAFNGPNGDEDPSIKGYMSSDRIHPSDSGHAAIAQELRKLAYKPLYSVGAESNR